MLSNLMFQTLLNRQSTPKGFTLIEIVIVLGIASILMAVGFSAFTSYRKSESLSKDTDLVVSVLQQARSQTLTGKNATAYGVHFESGAVTLFTGSAYTAGASSNQRYPLSSDITLTTNIEGGGSNVIFERITGETDHYGTSAIRLTSTTLASTTIRVYQTGIIEKVQ